MNKEQNLIIVIPAYNEEKNIARAIADCLTVVKRENIVVVDDGSQDKTAQIASSGGVNIVRHLINRGQGAALATGTQWALKHGADVIAHFDGDAQFEAHDIAQAAHILQKENVDVVLGSRFLNSVSNAGMPFLKKIMLKTAARWMNWVLTGVWLTDAHNGFRVLSGLAARSIAMSYDRMAHNSEIVRELRRKSLRFTEIAVKVNYKEYGQGLGDGVNIIKEWVLGRLI